ncbi:MAG: acetyltransferase, family [Firmicutes bacterium]|nr:acetyltransferase, family [Bacillota bacterium]
MKNLINHLEELALNAFPALTSELYDGWLLRFSNGYTYRANCINPLYASIIDITTKISYCENKYFSHGLPVVYKMTDFSTPDLDCELNKLGYQIKKQADIMTLPLLTTSVLESSNEVVISEKIEGVWLDNFLAVNNITDQLQRSTVKTIFLNIPNQLFCAYIKENNRIIGFGLGVLERNHLGLFDIYIDEGYRNQGIGKSICMAIIKAGLTAGARTAYLQVMSLNTAAINLYRKLGFSRLYTYWYRVKETAE